MPSIVTDAFRLASLQVEAEPYDRSGVAAYALRFKLGTASDAPKVCLVGLCRADLERVYAVVGAALHPMEEEGVTLDEVHAVAAEMRDFPFGRAAGE